MKRGSFAGPHGRGEGGDGGFALVGALVLLIVLTALGSGVYLTTRRDIVHTGRDLDRVRAEFAAESAAQWALVEVSRYDGGRRPYSRATHDRSGRNPLHPDPGSDPTAAGEFSGLDPGRLSAYSGAEVRRDSEGWIVLTHRRREGTFSRGASETLAFKVWYPDPITVRVSGRGTVDGASAVVEVRGLLDPALVPL